MRGMTDINGGMGRPMLVNTADVKASDEFAGRVRELMQESIPTTLKVHFWRFYENPSAKEGKEGWPFDFRIEGEKPVMVIRVPKRLVRKACQKTVASTAAAATRQTIAQMMRTRAERMSSLACQASEAVSRLKAAIEELNDLQDPKEKT